MLLSFLACADILFGNRLGLDGWQNNYRTNGNIARDSLLLACLAICVLRLFATLFVFFRRVMYWKEALVIANIMPWCLVYTAYYGGQSAGPLGWIEGAGIVLFVLGSYLNSAGELARYRWKRIPANKGHLYTQGLFKYVRHINYSGDVVLFSGLALLANELFLLVIPWGMFLIFLLVLVPLKEQYLSAKYGDEFQDYAARTKMLVPLIL